jgi:peptidoglycan/xylan/chitin deacetylase (PgdA/CDA1 family)
MMYSAFYRCGASRVLRRLNNATGRKVTVVTFHRVADREPDDHFSLPTLFMSREYFERTIQFLASRYRVVDLDELLAALEGRTELSDNSLLITFDDGYRDVFENALPVLERAGLPAVVFLSTAHVDSRALAFWWDECYFLLHSACAAPDRIRKAVATLEDPSLKDDLTGMSRLPSAEARRSRIIPLIHALQSHPERVRRPLLDAMWKDQDGDRREFMARNAVVDWSEARRAVQTGVVYGSHMQTHLFLHCESPEAVRRELSGSKREIEERAGHPVHAFAYPGGKLTPDAPRWVQEAGYRCAFTAQRGINSQRDAAFLLKRVNLWNGTAGGVGGSFSVARLASKLTARV